MHSSIKKLLGLLSGAALCAAPASAFSLLGEFEAWQEDTFSYNLPGFASVGAPKNIGEEYRYSTPVVCYGFDASFVDYFGEDGMAAIDAAFAVFNAVPAASAMTEELLEFPLTTRRVNRNAERLGLLDLKTQMMTRIMEQLGFLMPERYTWILRDAQDRSQEPWLRFLVANYNFDPVDHRPTAYVNGSLYSFGLETFFIGGTRYYDATEFQVDPVQPNVSLAAFGTTATQVPLNVLAQVTQGAFAVGLTRDDAGALRYVYSPNNRNYELAPTGSAIQGTFTGSGVGSGGGGDGSPWTPVIITAPATGGTTGGNTGATNAGPVFIDAAVRRGVDKVNFVRVDVDPILRRIRTPLLIRYTESIDTTNGVVNQRVERLVTTPDIIISASNLNDVLLSRSVSLVNNSAIDGISGQANGGPGNLDVGQEITFNNAGRLYQIPSVGGTQASAGRSFAWGSYDGTTNLPVMYPQGRYTFREWELVRRRELP